MRRRNIPRLLACTKTKALILAIRDQNAFSTPRTLAFQTKAVLHIFTSSKPRAHHPVNQASRHYGAFRASSADLSRPADDAQIRSIPDLSPIADMAVTVAVCSRMNRVPC